MTCVQVAGVRDACVSVSFSTFLPRSLHSMGTKASLSCFSSILNVWHTKVFVRKNGRNVCYLVLSACEKATEQQAEIAPGPGNQEAAMAGRQHGSCPVLSSAVASVT